MIEDRSDEDKQSAESKRPPDTKPLGIGIALRREREKKRWGLDRLATKTKIKREYLEALEEEDFDRLEHAIYLRLFLRAYAKELGLDGNKLFRLYQDHLEQQKPSPEEEEQRRREKKRAALVRRASGAAAVLVVLVLVGLFALRWSKHSDEPSLSAESLELAEALGRENAKLFRVRGLEDTWLQVVENDVNTTIVTLKQGEIRSWRTTGSIKFKVGNAFGLEAEWWGRPLGILGARGQVATRELGGEEE